MSNDPLSGDDGANITDWYGDLTYAETHAFTWGFGLTSMATATGSRLLMAAAAGLLLFAYTGKYARAKAAGVDVPDYVRNQIRREPHYYIGGAVAGAVVGYAAKLAGVIPPVPF